MISTSGWDKSVSGNTYLLLLTSEGTLTDLFIETLKLVEMDPMVNKKSSREIQKCYCIHSKLLCYNL